MFTLLADLADALPAEVAAYIPTYAPAQLLTEEQWARCDEVVWTLCARTLPPTREDAKTQMSVTCGFLAFTDTVAGSVDLVKVLTDENIDRFLVATERTASDQTRGLRKVRLRRAQRAAAGLPPRSDYGPRPAGPAPYSSAQLATLVDLAADSPAVAAVLAQALIGVVVPRAVGATPPAPADLQRALRRLDLQEQWVALVPDRPVTDADWASARTAAKQRRLTLSAAQLRASWVQAALAEQRPVAETAQQLGLTRADLDNAVAYLPAAQPEEVQQLLCG